MGTDIFYFSATGNSLVVARDLARALENVRIVSMPGLPGERVPTDADRIGLVFPVYFGGMPRAVTDFIGRLDVTAGRYLFAVCTCGAMPAGTLRQTRDQLRSKGLELHAGFAVRMPGNYLVKYGAIPRKIQARLFRREKEKVKEIASYIRDRQTARNTQGNFLINAMTAPIYRKMIDRLPALDRYFEAGRACNGCGTCRAVCPAANIESVDGRPHWWGQCQHCMACIQWCPKEAIQYGTKTSQRKRYHHPEVSVKDLMRTP